MAIAFWEILQPRLHFPSGCHSCHKEPFLPFSDFLRVYLDTYQGLVDSEPIRDRTPITTSFDSLLSLQKVYICLASDSLAKCESKFHA